MSSHTQPHCTAVPARETLINWLALLVLLALGVSWSPADAGSIPDERAGSLLLKSSADAVPLEALRQLTRMHAMVTGNVARVEVTQTFTNQSSDWMEGLYEAPVRLATVLTAPALVPIPPGVHLWHVGGNLAYEFWRPFFEESPHAFTSVGVAQFEHGQRFDQVRFNRTRERRVPPQHLTGYRDRHGGVVADDALRERASFHEQIIGSDYRAQ